MSCSSSSTSNEEIPGFYRDPITNKYFRIVAGHGQHNPLTHDEVAAKKMKLLEKSKPLPTINNNLIKLIHQRSLGINTGLSFQHNSITNMIQHVQRTQPKFKRLYHENLTHLFFNKDHSDIFAYHRSSSDNFSGQSDHEMSLLRPDPHDSQLRCAQKIIFPGDVEAYDVVQASDDVSNMITAERMEPNSNRYLQLYVFSERAHHSRLTLSLGLRNVKTISCCSLAVKPLRVVFSQRKSMIVCLDLDEVHLEHHRVRGQYVIEYTGTVTSSDFPHPSLLAVGTGRGHVVINDLRQDQASGGAISFPSDRFRGYINKIRVLRSVEHLIVTEVMTERHRVCLHDSRNPKKPLLEYIDHRSANSLATSPFYIDSNEGFIFIDSRMARNHGTDHIIRVYDVKRGTELTKYTGFRQLYYEESWPMFHHQPGFIGVTSLPRHQTAVEWLPFKSVF